MSPAKGRDEGAPKALLLDFGGVISITLFERHGESEANIGLASGTLTWRGPFDPAGDRLWTDMLAGSISERDYWAIRAAEVGRLKGGRWDMATLIRRASNPDPNAHVRPEALATVRRARAAGARVGLLTNELELFHGREEMERLEILRLIDSVVDATHTRILKPDPRAYALGCEALGSAPGDVVFFDDQKRNVEGALAAGLDAVWFDITRPAATYAEVERRLGLPEVRHAAGGLPSSGRAARHLLPEGEGNPPYQHRR
jgi:putative hydrolase of the HAD superfamily